MLSINKIKAIYEALTFLERVAFALISAAILTLQYSFISWFLTDEGTDKYSLARFPISHQYKFGSFSAIELVVAFIVFFGLWLGLALLIYRGSKRKK